VLCLYLCFTHPSRPTQTSQASTAELTKKEDLYEGPRGVKEVAAALTEQARRTQLTPQLPGPLGPTAEDVALAVWAQAPEEIKRLAALCDELKQAAPEVTLSVASPKGLARGYTKACTDARVALRQRGAAPAGGRGDAAAEDAAVAHTVARLYDISRAMIECPTMESMALALGALQARAAAAGYEVVRVKQRFEQPTAAGWSDIFVNVRSLSSGYTAELQFAHEKLCTCRGSGWVCDQKDCVCLCFSSRK